MSAVRFGFTDGATNFSYEAVESSARHLERLGATFLAFGESLTAGGDPFLHLAVAGRTTERLQLGTAVVTPGARHPALLARTVLSLNGLTGGRVFLGLGTGLFLGSGRSRLEDFERYCLAVRALVAGESVMYEGSTYRIQASGEGAAVPLWIAAEGPRSLQLAGRVADGVLVENGADPSVVGHVRNHVEIGARQAGRSPEDIDVWYMTRIRIDTSEHEAFRVPAVEAYGAGFASELWRVVRHGEGAAPEQIKRKKGLDVSPDVAERLESFNREARDQWGSPDNVALLDKHQLREWLAHTYFVLGTRDEVIGRVRALVEAGASNFMVPVFVPRVPEDVADVMHAVRGS